MGDEVLVVDEQLQRLGGSGQDADGVGSSGADWVGVAADSQDLSDPVDGRQKPDRIPGGCFGDNGFQSVFGVKGEHILGAAGPFGPRNTADTFICPPDM